MIVDVSGLTGRCLLRGVRLLQGAAERTQVSAGIQNCTETEPSKALSCTAAYQRLSSLTSPWATLCCGAHCCTSPSANASAHSLCLPLPSRMQPSRYSSPSSARDPVSTATQQIAAQLKAESPMQSGACSSCHNDPIQWTLTANHPSKS